jgi:NADPH:quinone reductase-like Zn-dependent oxidoreductase
VGGTTTQKLFAKVKPGGMIGSVIGEPAGAKERGLAVRAIFAHPDSKRLGELARAAAGGELSIPIAAREPLDRIRDAHALAQRGARGKVVLRVA